MIQIYAIRPWMDINLEPHPKQKASFFVIVKFILIAFTFSIFIPSQKLIASEEFPREIMESSTSKNTIPRADAPGVCQVVHENNVISLDGERKRRAESYARAGYKPDSPILNSSASVLKFARDSVTRNNLREAPVSRSHVEIKASPSSALFNSLDPHQDPIISRIRKTLYSSDASPSLIAKALGELKKILKNSSDATHLLQILGPIQRQSLLNRDQIYDTPALQAGELFEIAKASFDLGRPSSPQDIVLFSKDKDDVFDLTLRQLAMDLGRSSRAELERDLQRYGNLSSGLLAALTLDEYLRWVNLNSQQVNSAINIQAFGFRVHSIEGTLHSVVFVIHVENSFIILNYIVNESFN